METEDPDPEREPLKFPVSTDDLNEIETESLLNIKKVAETLLYHWRTFPIVLPTSLSTSNRESLNLKDLFIAPTFDELEEVALDESGDAKKLNTKQLQSVWDTGEFEVESIHFPGQVHRWRLTQLLQKGTKRAQESLWKDSALALRLIIITARNRFHSHFFSLTQSAKAWFKGLWKLLDIIIGAPSTTPGNLMAKIHEERTKYLIAELDIEPSLKEEWSAFCEFVKEKCDQLGIDKFKTTDLKPPPVPFVYQTPKGQEIDLRLFNRDLMNKCVAIISNILEQQSKGWFVQYRDRVLNELRDSLSSREELVKQVSERVKEEYLNRVYTAILASQEIERLQPGIGQLLVNQAKAIIVMNQAVDNVQEKLGKHREELKKHLEKSYPVKSRIPAWVNEQLAAFESDFVTQNLLSAHEQAIEMCRQKELHQALYFLQRDLNFIKEREPILKVELGKDKHPTREFYFRTRIWLPKNWIVKRHIYGESEVIPTTIVDLPAADSIGANSSETAYSLEQYTKKKTTTRYPFWRWWNYLNRTWAWMWNTMFFCTVVIPWCSPVSLRALVYPNPFYANMKLNRRDGTVGLDESSRTQTLVSMLRNIWIHVKKSRREFEATPDTGFLGKSFTRQLNRFWNYVLKGACGTFGVAVLFPPVCLAASLASFAVGVLTPIWMPIATLLVHIADILIFDFDRPDREHNAFFIFFEAIIWHLLIQGCLQPVFALLAGTIVCPLAACVIMLGGLLRRGGRGFWDTVMYHLLIKKRGRIPSREGFIARRIAGPGLASKFFYQVRPEQALAAFEAKMELYALSAWSQSKLRILDKPLHEFNSFVTKLFQPFSATLSTIGVYKALLKETDTYKAELNKLVAKRSSELEVGLSSALSEKIKLREKDLKLVLYQAAKILEDFYPDNVIKLLPSTEEEFWEGKQLEVNDYTGLAEQILKQVFSTDFLIPLEESDNVFKLKVQHLNLARYVKMIAEAEVHDDLDVVIPVHLPQGDLSVEVPTLDVTTFDPNTDRNNYTSYDFTSHWRRPWKKPNAPRTKLKKLEIPLSIPHPSYIAIMIYNRENNTGLWLPWLPWTQTLAKRSKSKMD